VKQWVAERGGESPIAPPPLSSVRPAAQAAAARLTLPFKRGLRRSVGNTLGAGTGSSIDFQDHRPYSPGDDPRHIDWQAYARSGQYLMKQYHEEVRPLADLVFDASASMFFDEAKGRRSLELAVFCAESAARAGAAIRIFSLNGAEVAVHEPQSEWKFTPATGCNEIPDLTRIPWRAASLRIWISDLLHPAAPEALLMPLLAGRGRGLILSPRCAAESTPDWLGNTELRDCENGALRDLRFGNEDMERYHVAYRQHFALWDDATRRHGVAFARVEAEGTLVDALSRDGLGSGVVDLV
jgi:uncharacterized protein (DUF58 family)